MKFTPHGYQKKSIQFLISHATAALFQDPGLGKTVTALTAFSILQKKKINRRALVVAPLRVCHSVWAQEAAKWDHVAHLRVNLLHGTDKNARLQEPADVDVINFEGLPWLAEKTSKLKEWPWDVLIVDECFPAGTRVRARTGSVMQDVKIEDMQPGDEVLTSAGLRSVLEAGTRVVSRLVRLQLASGRAIECTPEHPIFTNVGWLPAARTEGCYVYEEKDLCEMREGVSPHHVPAAVLLEILLQENDVGKLQPNATARLLQENAAAVYWRTVMEQGAPVARGAPLEDLGASDSERARVQDARRERRGQDEVRGEGREAVAARVHLELRDRIGWEAAWLSYLLQAGLCAPWSESGPGSGRGEPSTNEACRAGSQEGGQAGGTRVARVENIERSGTTVYNLRVEGCPHFFAEGILVHNCTRLKHTQTQRFRTIKPMLPKFQRRYILTGSPAPNGLLDLFGQIYILDLGNALGRFITHYRANYFDQTGYQGYTYIPRPGAEEAIYKKLKPLVLRMAAEDYLELPELIENRVEVELPPLAMRQYKQMEEILLTTLEEEVISAANASVAWGKCRQIANGGIFHEGGEKWSHIHEAKVDAVEEIINELSGKPCLVAYEYRHDLERLQKRFPDAPFIGGGVSTKRFREIESTWNAGEIPVLLAQPQSVAHGLNLQSTGAAIIFAGLTPDLEVNEQFVRRVWRQGQKERVIAHYLVAKGTVDEVIMKMLHRKDAVQKDLLNALKGHLRQSRTSLGSGATSAKPKAAGSGRLGF